MASDSEHLSTADLLSRVCQAQGVPARLFYMSLKLGVTLIGKPSIYQQLCGSLQVDITKTTQLLGWAPQVSVN
jgi:hypothetical protein